MALPLQQWWVELQRTTTTFNSLVLTLVLFLCFLFLLKTLIRGDKLKLPPSPPRLPIIGNLHQLGTEPHRSLRAISDKYGPLVLLHLGKAPTLLVSSADTAREIMKTHDTVFANRVQPKAGHVFYYGCTNIAFSPYGDYWRQVRKICVLELLSLKMVQSFQFVREEEVVELVDKIKTSCINGASINLSKLLVKISFDIVSKVVMGQKFQVEDGKKSFGDLVKKEVQLLVAFCFQDLFPSFGWMDVLTGLNASLKETSEELHAFLDEVFDEHKISDDDQSDKKDFIKILFRLGKEGMLDTITRDNLKAILMDMFIGGTDTTSSTMEWAMAELVKNPAIMKKAQEEVRRVVGKKSKIDETDIDQMDYLKCIIKETLRLYPPVPFLVPRESMHSVKLAGYDIPSKTRVFVNAWAIQRDPKSWDRPEEFLPERFANNPIDYKGQDFEYIPFGAGRRGCPGITFSIVEIEHVLANLLYWFDWELASDATEELDMSDAYGMSLHKKTPLNLVPLLHSF